MTALLILDLQIFNNLTEHVKLDTIHEFGNYKRLVHKKHKDYITDNGMRTNDF